MSNYTPSTEEVREEFIYGHQEVDMDGYVVVSFYEASARWERWFASVKAETLREAADAFTAELGANAANPAPKYIVGWLHNRAAKLEATHDA